MSMLMPNSSMCMAMFIWSGMGMKLGGSPEARMSVGHTTPTMFDDLMQDRAAADRACKYEAQRQERRDELPRESVH